MAATKKTAEEYRRRQEEYLAAQKDREIDWGKEIAYHQRWLSENS